MFLALGLGLGPRPGGARRAFLALGMYVGVLGLLNLAFGTNFLSLRDKPAGHTLVDWMGPWPVYILVGLAMALGIFRLLEQPWRARGDVAHES